MADGAPSLTLGTAPEMTPLAVNHPISVPTPLSSQEAVGRAERGRKTLQKGEPWWKARWGRGIWSREASGWAGSASQCSALEPVSGAAGGGSVGSGGSLYLWGWREEEEGVM